METLNWIVAAITAMIGLLGGFCTIGVPLVILIGLGIFLYQRSRKSTAARLEAQAWPSTHGTVLTSALQVVRTGRSRSEIPVVVYQYEVRGEVFQNQTIRAGDRFLNVRVAGQAKATVARYPVGASVTVYYNPANPAESALER